MQRWIYPVDKKRVNEFGQVFDENVIKELQQKEQQQLQSSSSTDTSSDVPKTAQAKKTE